MVAVAVNGFPVSVDSGGKAIKMDRSVVESRYLKSVFALRTSVGDSGTVELGHWRNSCAIVISGSKSYL